MNELKDFLKNKLNADDFFTAEELLNEVTDRLLGFLKKKLSFEDYMDAEEIVSEAILQTEEEAFCLVHPKSGGNHMKKIAGLYQNYRKELQEEFQDYCTGGDKVFFLLPENQTA